MFGDIGSEGLALFQPGWDKIMMNQTESVVATFADHPAAEAAIKQLNLAGFDIRHLSVVGKGYHLDEKVIGFYNQRDRIRFWGTRGAFWGGLWTLFFGGMFLTIPLLGPVIMLGYLAGAAAAVIEGAALVGGVSALAAALYGLGIPKDSVVRYETALAADAFLVMAHDTAERVAIAKAILEGSNASEVDVHATPEHPRAETAAALAAS